MEKKDRSSAKSSERAMVKLKKRKGKERKSFDESTEVCRTSSENEDNLGIIKEHKDLGKKNNKFALKKKRRRVKGNKADSNNDDQLSDKDEHAVNGMNSGSKDKSDRTRKSTHTHTLSEIGNFVEPKEGDNDTKLNKKVKKNAKSKKKDFHGRKTEETLSEVHAEKIDEISSVDEDSSRGMKKWISEYKQRRPGLKILQQRIDEFITAFEEQQDQERKEREARAAEGGWTVVVHHKGRKKTTDIESGITVGSVAQAAVMDKMAKKKSKEVSVYFYRFQKREAKRNEVMMLQSKFEQDKKRIQQLRAARKFRPY